MASIELRHVDLLLTSQNHRTVHRSHGRVGDKISERREDRVFND